MGKIKDRLLGVIVTLISSALMFLTYSYFGSFETKAAADSKYSKLDKKIDLVICLLDDTRCIK